MSDVTPLKDLRHVIKNCVDVNMTPVDTIKFISRKHSQVQRRDSLLTIDFFGYEPLQDAPYSPDLAPFDFAIFPWLKSDLRGKRFSDLQELSFAVRSTVKLYSPE